MSEGDIEAHVEITVSGAGELDGAGEAAVHLAAPVPALPGEARSSPSLVAPLPPPPRPATSLPAVTALCTARLLGDDISAAELAEGADLATVANVLAALAVGTMRVWMSEDEAADFLRCMGSEASLLP